MKSEAWECIPLATSTLSPADIPAIVYYDTQCCALVAEPVSRFYMRPDHRNSERYRVVLRISDDFFALLHMLRPPRRIPPKVIDITRASLPAPTPRALGQT